MTPTQTKIREHSEAIEIGGLHATTPETLSFAPSLEVRAFMLDRRERDNVLIYNTGKLGEDAEQLAAHGGVARQYLNHWHEATLGLHTAELGVRLLYHSKETPFVREHGGQGVAFSFRHQLDDDFEVIPIPGHTEGATAYLWHSGSERLLFSGDTIYLVDGKWRTALLESSDREAYIRSLELLREVEFDVLVPWAASAGGPQISVVSQDERIERLDALIVWLRSRAPR